MRFIRTILAACALLLMVDVAGYATATALTVAPINRTTAGGVDYDTAKAAAAAGGNYFANDGQIFLLVDNADTNATTVTIAWGAGANAAVDGVAPTARTYSVAAGKKRLIGPFPPLQYNDSSGYVQVSYSSVTTLNVTAFKLVAEKQQ